ncbi:hypothetical protein D3C72_2217730 [compost metagenome]
MDVVVLGIDMDAVNLEHQHLALVVVDRDLAFLQACHAVPAVRADDDHAVGTIAIEEQGHHLGAGPRPA